MIHRLIAAVLLLPALFLCFSTPACADDFQPGKPWLDEDGERIEAHAGGILLAKGVYYWYGENHRLGLGNKTGISVYTSTDIVHWKNRGLALPKAALPEEFRDTGICERPKVIYNEATKQYVMWAHLDISDYTAASAGVAVSERPEGPFHFLGAQRPIAYDYGYTAGDRTHERGNGNAFRDMTLYLDDDGHAYVIYAAEDNATLYIARLNQNFTGPELPVQEGKTWARVFAGKFREAPAMFKYRGTYYMLTSAQSGWSPNPSDYATAPSVLGPWTQHGNPAQGAGAETTFRSQPAFVLPAPGKPAGSYIYIGDRWEGQKIEDSTFVWLPFLIKDDGSLQLNWLDRWNLSIFGRKADQLDAPSVKLAGRSIEWQPASGADFYNIVADGKAVGTATGTHYAAAQALAGRKVPYTVIAANLKGVVSSPSSVVEVPSENAHPTMLGDVEPDSWKQGFGALQYNHGLDGGFIRIAGTVYAHGLGTHAPSEIVYRTAGHYSRFRALVGVDNAMKPEFAWKPSSVQFEVYGDGKLLYRSASTMYGETPAAPVDVALTGVQELRLVVTDAGDGNKYDHADWAEAELIP